MSEKEMTISEFVDVLTVRMENKKEINCCQVEIRRLAEIAKKKIPDEKITVEWKD